MPALRSSCLSSSSLSSFSISPQRQFLNEPTHVSLSEYLDQFSDNNDFEQLMSTIFEHNDFILKMAAMRHVAELIERLQGEVEEQQQYLRSRFEEMEQGGLHDLLDKGYERKYGTIWPKRRVQLSFTPPQPSSSRIL